MVNETRPSETSPPLQFSIEEQFLASKTGRLEDSEDAVYIGPHFVAVIDGATSKTERRWNGETGGKVAARLLCKTLDQLPHDVTAQQAFDLMTSALHQHYETQEVLDIVTSDPLQRLMACVAVVSFFREEVWSVGDCQCLLDHTLISQKSLVDEIASEARALFLESELLQGATVEELRQHDSGREFILPILQRQSRFQNNPAAHEYEYAVVDGFPIPESNILVYPIPEEVETIVLATDGYPIVKESLEVSEQTLREILQNDPLLFRTYKSTKGVQDGNASFDDRSYVKVRVKKETRR